MRAQSHKILFHVFLLILINLQSWCIVNCFTTELFNVPIRVENDGVSIQNPCSLDESVLSYQTGFPSNGPYDRAIKIPCQLQTRPSTMPPNKMAVSNDSLFSVGDEAKNHNLKEDQFPLSFASITKLPFIQIGKTNNTSLLPSYALDVLSFFHTPPSPKFRSKSTLASIMEISSPLTTLNINYYQNPKSTRGVISHTRSHNHYYPRISPNPNRPSKMSLFLPEMRSFPRDFSSIQSRGVKNDTYSSKTHDDNQIMSDEQELVNNDTKRIVRPVGYVITIPTGQCPSGYMPDITGECREIYNRASMNSNKERLTENRKKWKKEIKENE